MIEKRVEEQFQRDIVQQMPWAPKEVQGGMWESWMMAHYFEITSSICAQEKRGNSSVDVSDVSTSPKRRTKREQRVDTTGAVAFQSVEALHQAELVQKSPMGLEARVLHVPPEPRQSTVSNRYTGKDEQVPVITVVLADRTGPILFEAWRDAAEKIHRDLLQWESDVSDEQCVLVHVERFDVRDDTRARQTTMRKPHSTDSTTVKRAPYPMTDWIKRANIIPHPGLYTSDFNRLTNKPPFHISVTGTVGAVKPVTQSSNGADMQDFKLLDSSGRYFMCKAFGRHVGNTLVASGNEIILYFATARLGLSSQPGSLWLYDEAHVAVTAHAQTIPVSKHLLELRG